MASKSNRVATLSAPKARPTATQTTTPAAAADQVSLNNTRTHSRPRPSEDQIRVRAFFLWELAGRPDGDGVQFWLEAEKELSNPR